MSFAQPHLLWLLALPAALLLAAFARRAQARAPAHPKIPRASLGPSGLHLGGPLNTRSRPLAATAALALILLALARPQGAPVTGPVLTRSRDVLVAVDVSRSMLADDVPPSRLTRARLLIRSLADELRGERLGLLPFAGTAFLQSPLSADYEIFRTFLDELGPEMIPAGGSDFAALLRAADEAFGPPEAETADPSSRPDRFLVILSDGEADSEAWRPLARQLATRGVRVLALGLGTAHGATIPDQDGALVKDARGAVVLSRLQPATLQELARLTDGAYRDASTWVDLPALLRATVSQGRTALVEDEIATRRQELFAWFLAPALALLCLSLVRELPTIPRPPPVSSKSPRPGPPPLPVLLRSLPPLFATLALLGPPAPRAGAETTPPDPLLALVERLAREPSASAIDLGRLATLTAERAEAARAPASTPPAPVPEGAVRDALAAVAAGRATDPRAADWTDLQRRLEALLAPPPSPQKSEPPPAPSPSDSESSSSPDDQSSKSSSNNNPSSSPGSPSPDAANEPGAEQKNAPPPQNSAGSDPLGQLADSPPPASEPGDSPSPSDDEPGATDAPPDPAADSPRQQVGGVSASGRPSESGQTPALDPALVVPQQRLERVRDADAPARLFQLLQQAEGDPAPAPSPGSPRQTW